MTNERRKSKYNAVKHGIFAGILLGGGTFRETEEDFHRLVSAVTGSLQPSNALEEILVEKLAVLFLRLCRVYKIDFELAPKLFARVVDTLKTDHSAAEAIWISRDDQVMVVHKEPTPDLILRYETNLERQIGRTLDQISQLRTMLGREADVT